MGDLITFGPPFFCVDLHGSCWLFSGPFLVFGRDGFGRRSVRRRPIAVPPSFSFSFLRCSTEICYRIRMSTLWVTAITRIHAAVIHIVGIMCLWLLVGLFFLSFF